MDYIWLVPLFPLLGVVINGLFGIKFPKKIIGPDRLRSSPMTRCTTTGPPVVASCGY